MKKKAQITLQDAPNIVIVIGITFLMLATLAFIGYKYGNTLDTPTTVNKISYNIAALTEVNSLLSGGSLKQVSCSTISNVTNASSGAVIAAGNYTQTGCLLKTTATAGTYNNTPVNVTYSYTYQLDTTASNVTNSLQDEIQNNTSIMGIVLTVALVGIVLAVLIGIFVLSKRRGL